METYYDCLRAIHFLTLKMRYKALGSGYLGGNPYRKLWAILKGIVQAQSPCLDQRKHNCRACMQSEECLFLKLFVEDSEKDYLPYVLSPADESSWIGSVRAGSLNAFNLVLIGERISSHPELVDAIRRKKQVVPLRK